MPNPIQILRDRIKNKIDVVNNQKKLRVILNLLNNEKKLQEVIRFLDNGTFRSHTAWQDFQNLKTKFTAFDNMDKSSEEAEIDGLVHEFITEIEKTYNEE